jgi:mono/diheme cytochrome c family protein
MRTPLLRAAAALGVALGLAAAVTACSAGTTTGTTSGTGTTATTTPATVSFKSNVAPLLSSACAGCHTPGGMGSQDFVAFDASGAVNQANVKAKIADIIAQTKSGAMPRGRSRLTADQLAILTNWQAAGTPDN